MRRAKTSLTGPVELKLYYLRDTSAKQLHAKFQVDCIIMPNRFPQISIVVFF